MSAGNFVSPMFEHCNMSSSRLLVSTDCVDWSRLSHATLNFVELMPLFFFGSKKLSVMLSLSDVIVLLSFPSSELHDVIDSDQFLSVTMSICKLFIWTNVNAPLSDNVLLHTSQYNCCTVDADRVRVQGVAVRSCLC